MKFTIYQESRPGKRPNNEDRVAYCYSRDALLMIVADGMGGHFYGEVAAQIAVQTLTELFQRDAMPEIGDPFLFLQKSILAAHNAIVDFSILHNLQDSPRTTIVACLIQNNIAYWAHAGDSRLYLMRAGKVVSRTKDHTRIQILIDEGIITPAQAAVHPDRNKVYSCLGGNQPPEIEFSRKTPLESGDVLALCTDGVWGVIPEFMLAAALKGNNLLQTVPALLNHIEDRGGPSADNYSIVTARWEDSYVEGKAETGSVISTQTMSRDTITTKLDEFGRNPNYKSDLTEDEIEKAIQEIRSTIQKFSK